jgi:TRAP transporter TAXI family solute receptor
MKRERWLKVCYFVGIFIIVPIWLLSVPTSFVSGQTTSTYPKVLRFATHSAGTTFNAVGSGLAKVASDKSPMTVIVIPTAGTSSWVSTLNESGSPNIGIEVLPIVWQMRTGKPAPDPVPNGFPPKAPYAASKNIRVLMTGTALHVGMLTRKDSGLKEVSDLRGKRIGWEWAAFPANIAITLGNLFNGGLTLDDVKTVPMTEVVAGVRAVQEKRTDATTCAVGMGAVAEADALAGVRFLRNSMDPERNKAGQRAQPGAYTILVPGGLPGVPEETPIWSMTMSVLASTHMADHVAYKLVETWWVHHKEFWPIHPMLKGWGPELFVNKNVTAPYHNGAIQFYKEKGVWTPEMEKIQNQFLKGN